MTYQQLQAAYQADREVKATNTHIKRLLDLMLFTFSIVTLVFLAVNHYVKNILPASQIIRAITLVLARLFFIFGLILLFIRIFFVKGCANCVHSAHEEIYKQSVELLHNTIQEMDDTEYAMLNAAYQICLRNFLICTFSKTDDIANINRQLLNDYMQYFCTRDDWRLSYIMAIFKDELVS